MTSEIRLAKKGEGSVIADLLYQSFNQYKSFYTPAAFRATVVSARELEERICNEATWVASVNGAISATISLTPSPDSIFIRSLAVLPGARGLGLGKNLMAHAEEIARKRRVKLLELTSLAFLNEAMALYKSLGFVSYGMEEFHGLSLIKMMKKLEAHEAESAEKRLLKLKKL